MFERLHLLVIWQRCFAAQMLCKLLLSLALALYPPPAMPYAHTYNIRTYMYMYYFSQPEFFLLLLLLRAFSRIQTQHTYRAASLALPACCAQLLLPSPSSLHTMLCCAVITAFALCYIFSLRFVHFALHSHSRTHVHVRIHRYTHTHRHRPENVYEKATTEKQRRRRRLRCDCEHTAVLLYFFFFVSLPLCVSCVQTRFVVELRKKSEKPLCEINI